MFKKSLMVLLLSTALCATACGQSGTASSSSGDAKTEETAEETAEEAPAEETAAAEEPAEEAPAEESAAAEETAEETAEEAPAEGEADAAQESMGQPDPTADPDTANAPAAYADAAEAGELIQGKAVEINGDEPFALPETAVSMKAVEAKDEAMITDEVNEEFDKLPQQDVSVLQNQRIYVYSSSTLGGGDYDVYNLFDGDVRTAWVEGVPGYGAGEFVELGIPAGTKISYMGMIGGYHKSEDLFYKNSAPAEIAIVSGNQVVYCTSNPQYGYMEEFTFPAIVSNGSVRVYITAVRPGSAYSDTCISEIWF
ncbi:MAG: hypothetical protein IJG52_00045 [Lachnospiraceae bacterium]|nr:hypothetical protein [Lachnospiraceae bacterium]